MAGVPVTYAERALVILSDVDARSPRCSFPVIEQTHRIDKP
jgi:hypothetical protein